MFTSQRKTRIAYPYLAGAGALLVALTGCGQSVEGADGEASSYEGKDVELVVPYGPGGGYDVYARAIAPYLGDCLGAQIVVKNEPGAGGLLATNATGAADPDEPRLQITNTVGAASAQIARAPGVQYDMTEMSLIGRVAAPADSVAVAGNGPIRDFQQIIDAEDPVRFVATGPGSNEYITPKILSAAYGFPLKMITGFPGSGEARLAVVSGDAEAHVQSWDSQLSAVESGEVRSVVLATDEPVKELSGTPTVMDFEPKSEEGKKLRDDLVELNATGRGIVAPPELPGEQLAELRAAFDCALGNEELLAELESQERPVHFLPGAEWEKLVEGVIDASPEFQAVVSDSF
jgi:tripartite-type tricarboxylate transporter receptor subunit TctC